MPTTVCPGGRRGSLLPRFGDVTHVSNERQDLPTIRRSVVHASWPKKAVDDSVPGGKVGPFFGQIANARTRSSRTGPRVTATFDKFWENSAQSAHIFPEARHIVVPCHRESSSLPSREWVSAIARSVLGRQSSARKGRV